MEQGTPEPVKAPVAVIETTDDMTQLSRAANPPAENPDIKQLLALVEDFLQNQQRAGFPRDAAEKLLATLAVND